MALILSHIQFTRTRPLVPQWGEVNREVSWSGLEPRVDRVHSQRSFLQDDLNSCVTFQAKMKNRSVIKRTHLWSCIAVRKQDLEYAEVENSLCRCRNLQLCVRSWGPCTKLRWLPHMRFLYSTHDIAVVHFCISYRKFADVQTKLTYPDGPSSVTGVSKVKHVRNRLILSAVW
jgi:hypothetical protein